MSATELTCRPGTPHPYQLRHLLLAAMPWLAHHEGTLSPAESRVSGPVRGGAVIGWGGAARCGSKRRLANVAAACLGWSQRLWRECGHRVIFAPVRGLRAVATPGRTRAAGRDTRVQNRLIWAHHWAGADRNQPAPSRQGGCGW